MENKINIAKLLKDCPKGMELDYALFEDTIFIGVEEDKNYPILIKLKDGSQKRLTKYGGHSNAGYAKCVIFPKGKNSWEGFVPPCEFKDGDIIYNRFHKVIGIYHSKEDESPCVSHCRYNEFHKTFEILNEDLHIAKQDYRLASNDEKQKFFDVIKAHGYKWNPEVKTLEKLSRFKVGDRIKPIYNSFQYDIKELNDTHYTLVEVEDKFKYTVPIVEDKDWELVPNKFDITTLKPFDKVLVRDGAGFWRPSLFGKDMIVGYRYFTACGNYKECIPYENNEHLLGTRNDCDDFYKTW